MKRYNVIIIMLIVLLMSSSAIAGDWEFHFFGVNMNDLKGRNWKYAVLGAATSLLAHEVLGHMLASEITGMGPAAFETDGMYVQAGDRYWTRSDDQKAFFSASGLLVQGVGSVLLTAIPATRHSDYTLGWNTCTFINGFSYGITEGINTSDVSDVKLMNKYGWPGNGIAIGTGVVGGIATYISLDKEKDEVQ